jgi:hypothetical protein
MNFIPNALRLLALVAATFAGFLLVGCDNKETLLDVDTRGGGVEVQRDRGTGEVTVDAK